MSIKKIYNEIILVWNKSTQSYDTVYEDSYLHDGEVYEMMPRNPFGDIEKMVKAGKGKGSRGDDVPKNKFDKHIFVCINSREDINKASCGEKGFAIRTALVKELASHPNIGIKARINKSGCLSECQLGPTIVIYPQGFWYYRVSLSDISEIVKKSIIGNEYIERLSK